MRLVQVSVPDDTRDTVEETLQDAGIVYRVLEAVDDAAGSDEVLVVFPLPTEAVEPIMEELRADGVDEEAFVVVSSVELTHGANADELSEAYVEAPTGERGVSHSELRRRAQDLRPSRASYVALALLSAIVAAAGLLQDSAIVIVGAMVIAPFAGSTLSVSVGAVLGDRKMIVDNILSQAAGLGLGVLGSVLVSAVLVRTAYLPRSLVVSHFEQVSLFVTPSLLALAIAFCAGAAGALALATDLPVSIAGVAVAAAIVPSAAAVGIGLVWWELTMVAGALALLVMNIVLIDVTASVTLLVLGYRSSVVSDAWSGLRLNRKTVGTAVLLVGFLVVAAAVVAATAHFVGYERTVHGAAADTLDDSRYGSLTLLDVSTSYDDVGLLGQPETVTVVVGRSADAEYPRLDERLRRRIERRTGQRVLVRVRFVDYSESGPNGALRDPPAAPGAVTVRATAPSAPAVAARAPPTAATR